MIDLEKILVIGLGSLVIVNFCLALALTIDWTPFRRMFEAESRARAAKWWAVCYLQWERATFPGATRLAWRRYLLRSARVAWVTVLVVVAAPWKGW